MKCIKKDETIVRVADDEAHNKVTNYGWRYVPRSEWKEKVRDKKALVSALADKGKEAMTEVLVKHQKTKERRAKNHSRIKAKQQ